MKLLHLADLHLGKSLGDFDLTGDQRFILEQIIDLAREESVDAVLMAGDVYDKSVPSEAATRLLDFFLSRLSEEGVKVFLISGNHDSDDRLQYGSSLFRAQNVFIAAVFDGTVQKQTLTDAYGEVDIYMLPFVKASQVRHFYPDEEIENYEGAVRTVLAHAAPDRTKRNILIAHQFVAGRGEDPALGGSEGAGTQSVGLVEKIGYGCFEDFDYVALGHIHSPQSVGRREIRYAGSPLKYSLSEVHNEKSVPLITLGEKGEVKIDLIPLKPLRDVRHIKGKMQDLLSRENVRETEDFIYATLTDEDIISDAMGILQQVYPNTVRIDYDNSRTRAVERADISSVADQKSFSELIGDFYRWIYGCEISGEEMEIMRMAAREAGVMDETD